MAKRLRTSVSHMNCDRTAIGDSVVKFTRVGREWISEPVTDQIAEVAESHPHFAVYETDEEIVALEIDPSTVDFSDAVEVERMLRTIPADELPEFVRVIENTPNLLGTLVNSLDEDTLREVARREVFADDLIGYVKEPVQVLRNVIVSNADFLDSLRAKSAPESSSEAVFAGGVTRSGELDQSTLTDEERNLFAKLNLNDGESDEAATKDEQHEGSSDAAATDGATSEPSATGNDGGNVPDADAGTSNESEDPLEAAIETAKRNKKAK